MFFLPFFPLRIFLAPFGPPCLPFLLTRIKWNFFVAFHFPNFPSETTPGEFVMGLCLCTPPPANDAVVQSPGAFDECAHPPAQNQPPLCPLPPSANPPPPPGKQSPWEVARGVGKVLSTELVNPRSCHGSRIHRMRREEGYLLFLPLFTRPHTSTTLSLPRYLNPLPFGTIVFLCAGAKHIFSTNSLACVQQMRGQWIIRPK